MNARSTRFFTLLILVFSLFLPDFTFAAGHHKDGPLLRVTFLDVGQGDAILIRSKEKVVLIDAGNDNDHAAEDIILPFLEKEGIKKIDTAVITHAHRDHFGGFLTLAQAVPIGEFIYSTSATIAVPGDPETTKGDDVLYKRLFSLAREKNIPLRKARMTDAFNWGSQIHVDLLHADHLHPAPAPGQPALTANDTSLVFKVTTGKVSYLFTGDATAFNEREMLADKPSCFPCTVLKVGHHGSKTSSSEAFIDAVKPAYAAIPVGISNSYRHPSPDVVKRFASRDVKIYRTDHDGTVESSTDGTSVVFSSNQTARDLHHIATRLEETAPLLDPEVAASRREAVGDLLLNSFRQRIDEGTVAELEPFFAGGPSEANEVSAGLAGLLRFRQLHREATAEESELLSSLEAAAD
ncbi:MAG TPA: ComEC/Rec2 family competence protein [Candidatus Ozemobacteraceae bacterium]|nr:ComEC/Rec2 family competence protein [Candidatus Ozemobacteraceae bacterium]